MFKAAAEVHARNASRSLENADFVTTAKKEYRDFVRKVPSQAFRDTLAKAENIVSMRPVQSILAAFRAVDDERSKIAQSAPPAAPAADPAPAAPAPEAAVASATTPEPAPAAAAPSATPAERPSALLGLDHLKYEPVDGYLGVVLREQQNGARAPEEETLFRAVSRKLRELDDRENLARRSASPVVPSIAQR